MLKYAKNSKQEGPVLFRFELSIYMSEYMSEKESWSDGGKNMPFRISDYFNISPSGFCHDANDHLHDNSIKIQSIFVRFSHITLFYKCFLEIIQIIGPT